MTVFTETDHVGILIFDPGGVVGLAVLAFESGGIVHDLAVYPEGTLLAYGERAGFRMYILFVKNK